jgi:hypothetical protein
MEKALRRVSAPIRAENRSPTDGAEKSAAEIAGEADMTVGQLLETIASKTATAMHDIANAVLSADVETVIGNIWKILPLIAAVVAVAALLAVLGWLLVLVIGRDA